ncbi:MAG TPA: PEGA domain-containing protein [Kofleriaceae bacterium]|nr:PEGA domain-containing protein [Kofleriaceae bacterium]
MHSRVVFVMGLVICALAARPALGQPADALKKAQSAFDQAQLDYLQGKYDEAAKGFQDAYTARAFPQFLYNVGASYHMKGKKASDAEAYQKAVDAYRSYLKEDPKAADKAKVEKAIGVLEAEIKRIKAEPAATPAPTGTSPAPAVSAAAPSQEVQQLGDVKVRGLVVIESEPSNATIYVDDKRKGAFATTPWSGTLEGDHRIIIEKRGYTVVEKTISADPSKLFVLFGAMSQQSFLGWVEISANVPGADIFIDDKSVGSVGRTPLSQNIKPGKHTFWISADGYDEYKQEIDVIANEVTPIKATLKGAPVGKLNVTGLGIEDATIVVDGKVLCERGPCLKSVAQGDHTVTVTRPGFKSYSRPISIQAKTETQVRITLQPTPGRGDAIITGVLALGFGAGGVVLGKLSADQRDGLRKDIDAGITPPDSNDPRLLRGKIYAIAADATFVIAGVTALTAIYYTFRDKGAPSTGLIDVRALAIVPEVGPGYAGLGMGVSW